MNVELLSGCLRTTAKPLLAPGQFIPRPTCVLSAISVARSPPFGACGDTCNDSFGVAAFVPVETNVRIKPNDGEMNL